MAPPVRTGLDLARRDGLLLPGKGRVALLCNGTSVAADWTPTAEAVARIAGVKLEKIFSPQHGFAAEKQDNMVASWDCVHRRLGVPIVSLYGERREPSAEEFDGVDLLMIDLPDVGTRVYTFLVTAALCIRVAARCGVQVTVLDRPNPIGGAMEGPVLEESFASFVGIVDVPLRHGLTAGEFCRYAGWRLGLPADVVRVVPVEGWRRDLYQDETGLPWTMPSPNLPTLETAVVYPGQVLLEGTNLSEGRGTTRPFELFGAPYLDPMELGKLLADSPALAGCRLREVDFEPTFQKHRGRLVRGFQIHVTDRARFRPVVATTAFLREVRMLHGAELEWREPPYEYERVLKPIDLLYGTDSVRRAIDAGESAEGIAASWTNGVQAFRDRVQKFLLYP